MNRRVLILILIIMQIIYANIICGQNIESYIPPVKIIESSGPEPGYFFISSRVLNNDTAKHFVAIVDNYGTPVYYKRNYLGNGGFRLQKNGYLTFRPNYPGFGYFVLDSSFNRIDTLYMSGYNANQHDFKISEDGHALFIGDYTRNIDMSQIVEGGNPNANVTELVIQEFNSLDSLIFEWRSWEHFDILDADEEAVNFTSSIIDYVHPNGIEFDSDTSILLSSRHLNEITKIDRRTGDIIWRLGGKKNQFTFINDTIGFSYQHSIVKLENGNIMLFDNGNYDTPRFSSAVEYTINEDLMTATLVKRYRPYFDIFASFGCNTQRLKGGNTLLGLGETTPSLIELRPDNSIALIMDFSDYASSLLITKQPWETNLFTTNTNTIDFPKDEYVTFYYLLKLFNNSDEPVNITGYSTHTSSFYIDESFPFTIPANGDTIINVAFNPTTQGYITDILTINSDIVSESLIQRIARQVYLSGTSDDFNPPVAIISPSNEGSVPLDAKIYIEFDDPVRFVDNSRIDYTNIEPLLTFKKTDDIGEDVGFIVNVSTDKKLITLKPVPDLEEDQAYYVSVSEGLEDYSDNPASAYNASFTTADIDPPQPQFDPGNWAENISTTANAIIRFNEPIRLIDNREIDNTNVDSLITFKEATGDMKHIPFDATITASKTKITIDADSALKPFTQYVVIIENIEDYHDNAIDTSTSKSYFTTGESELSAVSVSELNSIYRIFPNPSDGKFVIEFNSIETRKIEVYNFTGNNVYNNIFNDKTHIVDLDELPSGMYFIKITKLNSSEKILFKVIKR